MPFQSWTSSYIYKNDGKTESHDYQSQLNNNNNKYNAGLRKNINLNNNFKNEMFYKNKTTPIESKSLFGKSLNNSKWNMLRKKNGLIQNKFNANYNNYSKYFNNFNNKNIPSNNYNNSLIPNPNKFKNISPFDNNFTSNKIDDLVKLDKSFNIENFISNEKIDFNNFNKNFFNDPFFKF